ncbi:hypothetical protein [Rhodococcus sp. NPDC055024]
MRRFYYASSVDELLGAPRAGRPTFLDEFAEHLHERFNDGHTSTAALYEELQALGYRGRLRAGARLLETAAHPRRRAGQETNSEGPANHLVDAAACHIVRGYSRRTPWRTIKLVDVSRLGR